MKVKSYHLQFKQLERRSLKKKSWPSTGFKPVTSELSCFLLSESNNPSKVKTSRKQQAPKAANSKSNKSYYFWKFMVHGYGKQLKQGTK